MACSRESSPLVHATLRTSAPLDHLAPLCWARPSHSHHSASAAHTRPHAMVANRDEALRALAIAQRHLDSDNYDSAIRFANKSIQLEPTQEARKLLDRAKRLRDGGSSSSNTSASAASSSATSAGPSAASTSQRTSASSSAGLKATAAADSPPAAAAAPKQYTSAQLAVVKRVRACRTTSYYEILELEKSCSDGQVKKAYRKVRASPLSRRSRSARPHPRPDPDSRPSLPHFAHLQLALSASPPSLQCTFATSD